MTSLAPILARLPAWARESYEERVAIMECDDVPEAERKALDCVMREMRRRAA